MVKAYEAGDPSTKPDVFVFSVLMKACARTRGTQKDKHSALSMAFDAMKVLETTEFGPPNHIAFISMRAVNRLLERIGKSQISDVRISTMRCWWTRLETGHCRSASVGIGITYPEVAPRLDSKRSTTR
jgi:hypothetical protein